MNSLGILDKELEISYMEAYSYVEASIDLSCIQMYTEEVSEKSFFQKIKEKIKDLFDKVVSSIKNFFNNEGTKKKISDLEAMDQRILNDAKVEIIDSTKKNAFTKKYIEKIKSAKSVDEINKIMNDYEKKKKITKFTVLVTGAAALVLLKKKRDQKFTDAANQAYDDYAKAIDNLEKSVKDYQSGLTYNKYGKFISDQSVDVDVNSANLTGSKFLFDAADKRRKTNTKYDKSNIKYTNRDVGLLHTKASELSKLTADIAKSEKDSVVKIFDSIKTMELAMSTAKNN